MGRRAGKSAAAVQSEEVDFMGRPADNGSPKGSPSVRDLRERGYGPSLQDPCPQNKDSQEAERTRLIRRNSY